MICGNELCIYNEANECGLETVTIDSAGMCESCIIVSIDKSILDAAKQSQLAKYEEQYKE
jgi:trimethylamine:corrinoid methyltransferase-like protein